MSSSSRNSRDSSGFGSNSSVGPCDSRIAIIVDTREQHAYGFDGSRVRSIRKALPAGDYSLEGYEESVAVERKTLNDFVSTVIRGRQRFTKELKRLQSYEYACVVVEASLKDIVSAKYHSRAHPNAILGSVVSIMVDYGIPVLFCTDRQHACLFVENYLASIRRRTSRQCHQDQNNQAPDS